MSRFNTRNLDRLGNQVRVTMKADEDGYFGRECPIKECLGYFKVTPGTGIQGPAPCHCPYCGHSGDSNTFWTQEQLEYAKSVALRQFTDALHSDLKSMEFEHRPRGSFGVGISLKFKPGAPVPIRYYREKALETEVVCDHCTLRYTIYGVFGWCPDCGVHNSLQILGKNLELARKQLVLAESVERNSPPIYSAMPWHPLTEPERRDFWEVCEDRYQVRSLILTSQLPVPAGTNRSAIRQ